MAMVNPTSRRPMKDFSEKARRSTNLGNAAIAARRDEPSC